MKWEGAYLKCPCFSISYSQYFHRVPPCAKILNACIYSKTRNTKIIVLLGSCASTLTEGKEYYNDYMKIQIPGDEPTPESDLPHDKNFTCPYCGKVYHEDQRLYLKRHIEGLCDKSPQYDSLNVGGTTDCCLRCNCAIQDRN